MPLLSHREPADRHRRRSVSGRPLPPSRRVGLPGSGPCPRCGRFRRAAPAAGRQHGQQRRARPGRRPGSTGACSRCASTTAAWGEARGRQSTWPGTWPSSGRPPTLPARWTSGRIVQAAVDFVQQSRSRLAVGPGRLQLRLCPAALRPAARRRRRPGPHRPDGGQARLRLLSLGHQPAARRRLRGRLRHGCRNGWRHWFGTLAMPRQLVRQRCDNHFFRGHEDWLVETVFAVSWTATGGD